MLILLQVCLTGDNNGSMNKGRRIFFATLTPPVLAGLVYTLGGYGSDSIGDRIVLLPIFIVTVYCFGLLPSFVYALIMDIWIRNNIHKKVGRFFTIVFSTLLGGLSGLFVFILSQPYTQATTSDYKMFLEIGCLVGAFMGVSMIFLLKQKDSQ